jgi:hypothetical protein
VWATYIDFDSRSGSISTAGLADLEPHGSWAAFAKATGYTEQIGAKPGTPWRNPATGIVRMLTFQSDDVGDCITRESAVNTALNQVCGVMNFLTTWDG